MDIDTAVYRHFSYYSNLTALVDDRIYPLMLPQDKKLPAVVFFFEKTEPIGAFQAETTLFETMLRVIALARTKTAVIAISNQVQSSIQDYTGFMGSGGYLTTEAGEYLTTESGEYLMWEDEYGAYPDDGVTVQKIQYRLTTEHFDNITETFTKEVEATIWHN